MNSVPNDVLIQVCYKAKSCKFLSCHSAPTHSCLVFMAAFWANSRLRAVYASAGLFKVQEGRRFYGVIAFQTASRVAGRLCEAISETKSDLTKERGL